MDKLVVCSSPHIKTTITTKRIMLDVVISLIPAIVASSIIFGIKSLYIISISIISCVLFEYITRKIMKRSNSIDDLSAVVTGILLALSYPVSVPFWIPIIGAIVAIVAVKQLFGGIGNNIVNPAIAARVVLFVSFPVQMTNWNITKSFIDGITSATPLSSAASNSISGVDAITITEAAKQLSWTDLFFGLHGGSLGETCIFALLLGAIYLIIKKIISPLIPFTYLATVAIGYLFVGNNPLYYIMSGGVVLGAFFMATDYVTTPVSDKGKIIFGLGCGAFTVFFRIATDMPGGVSYAILLMNLLVPLIDRYTKTKAFGYVKKIKGGKVL